MAVIDEPQALSPKDYASDQEVRWCPGCGDYAVLKAMLRTLADISAVKEKTVFVSGIGCAARFPYYVSTYGFHTIHGRAPAFATGLKLVNPELDVWIVTGDGDGLSIGGNHLMHLLRRNPDVQLLLFNNEIYGLTKGQSSPTSRAGTRSPSTPGGSTDRPVSPGAFALGSGARFVARGIDIAQKHLPEIFARAHAHKGASFVEIFQNCIVYNDGVFDDFAERSRADDNQLIARHGEPLLFGKERDKGLRARGDGLGLEVVTIGEGGVTAADVLLHDETDPNLAWMLVNLSPPDFPMVLGVIYCNPAPTYEGTVHAQVQHRTGQTRPHDLGEILDIARRKGTWTVG